MKSGELIVGQFQIENVLHVLPVSLHDLNALVVDIFVDEGKDLLLLLVHFLDLLRNDVLLFGAVQIDLDQLLSKLLRNLKHQVLLQESALSIALHQLFYLHYNFFLRFLVLLQSVQSQDAVVLQLLELLHLDASRLNLDAHSICRQHFLAL